jgi:hypothetical protein
LSREKVSREKLSPKNCRRKIVACQIVAAKNCRREKLPPRKIVAEKLPPVAVLQHWTPNLT